MIRIGRGQRVNHISHNTVNRYIDIFCQNPISDLIVYRDKQYLVLNLSSFIILPNMRSSYISSNHYSLGVGKFFVMWTSVGRETW